MFLVIAKTISARSNISKSSVLIQQSDRSR